MIGLMGRLGDAPFVAEIRAELPMFVTTMNPTPVWETIPALRASDTNLQRGRRD